MALWKDEGERDFGEGMDVIPGARVFGKKAPSSSPFSRRAATASAGPSCTRHSMPGWSERKRAMRERTDGSDRKEEIPMARVPLLRDFMASMSRMVVTTPFMISLDVGGEDPAFGREGCFSLGAVEEVMPSSLSRLRMALVTAGWET